MKTEPTTQQKIAGLDKEIARRKNELRFLYIFAPILPIGGIGVLGMYVQISPDPSASSFANSIALWVCISGLTCILLTIPLSFMRRDLLERRSLLLESLKHQNE